jgi:hypothetical protein
MRLQGCAGAASTRGRRRGPTSLPAAQVHTHNRSTYPPRPRQTCTNMPEEKLKEALEKVHGGGVG